MGIIAHFVPFGRHTTRTLWPSTCVEWGLSERPLPHFSHFFLQALKVFFCPSADRLCLRAIGRHAGGMQSPQCQSDSHFTGFASDITNFEVSRCVTFKHLGKCCKQGGSKPVQFRAQRQEWKESSSLFAFKSTSNIFKKETSSHEASNYIVGTA